MEKQMLCKKDIDLLSQYGLRNIDSRDALRISFEAGEHVTQESGTIDYVYFIVSGKAKVCLSVSNGKQLLLCYFVSSGIIGDIELMTDKREAFSTVQAVSKLICIALPLSTYASALKNNIVFINFVGKRLAEKLMRSSTNGAITILHPLEARLCAYILQTSNNEVFQEKLTEVAEHIGTSYRHLLRCLEKLCEEEIIIKKHIGYEIANHQELNSRAGDLYVL